MRGFVARLAAAVLTIAAPAAAGVVVSAAAPAAVAQATWKGLTETDGRFAVELPGTPTVKRWTQDAGGGLMLENVEYTLVAGGDEFTVGSSNFKMDVTEDQLQVGFKAAIDDLVAKSGGTESWRRATTVSGKTAVEAEYVVMIGGANYRHRVVVTFGGQRLYTMSVRQPVTAPVSTAERALRSLRLL